MNSKPSTYTVLLLMNATAGWLALSRQQRADYVEEHLLPLFGKFSHSCRVRMYDSEYFHAAVSDFLIIDTDNLKEYGYLMEHLRDSKVYAEPYFEVKDIIVGQENAFKDFENHLRG